MIAILSLVAAAWFFLTGLMRFVATGSATGRFIAAVFFVAVAAYFKA